MDAWFNQSAGETARVERSAEQQAAVDAQTSTMSLYHYASCMYCARTRGAIAALQLDIELRDVQTDAGHRRDLQRGGGRTTVPCLRIDDVDGGSTTWMYESADIIDYLEGRFGAAAR